MSTPPPNHPHPIVPYLIWSAQLALAPPETGRRMGFAAWSCVGQLFWLLMNPDESKGYMCERSTKLPPLDNCWTDLAGSEAAPTVLNLCPVAPARESRAHVRVYERAGTLCMRVLLCVCLCVRLRTRMRGFACMMCLCVRVHFCALCAPSATATCTGSSDTHRA